MRIAVCLSGQPRSIEYCAPALLKYFQNTKTHTYDFFCHTWDYNTWKVKEDRVKNLGVEYVDTNWIEEQVRKLNPIQYQIDPRGVIYDNPEYTHAPWASLFYSAMMANHFKRLHEAKHGFRYDCVARGRFDIIFQPGLIFTPMPMRDRTLYHTYMERFVAESSFLNASDPFFYGDSWGMDIVSDIFRNIVRDRVNMHRVDNMSRFGPGTLMSRYCRKQNVEIVYDGILCREIIYRKEMLGKDPEKDFAEINRNHHSYYVPN